jgi:hypothetical protein
MRTILKAGLIIMGLIGLSGCKAYNCGCPMSSQPPLQPPVTHQSTR